LIKLLSGLLTPQTGQVLLGGVDVRQIRRRDVARRLAVVPQETHTPFAFTVWEMVMMGRTPHVRLFGWETERDRRAVSNAMILTDTLDFAARHFNELSGGEKQRVVIAMTLAQEAPILLLDEPTVHLDLHHQIQVLQLVRRLNKEQGKTVVAVMHDLNLAALYFDQLALISKGHIVSIGSPKEVITRENIGKAFQTAVQIQKHPVTGVPQVIVVPEELQSLEQAASFPEREEAPSCPIPTYVTKP
jgi:iron complex transport system ATP-binding protein